MELSLEPRVQKLIADRVNSGEFASPEDVVTAAILALDQLEHFGDFDAGEMDSLLAEGERIIVEDGTLDGEEAYLARGDAPNGQRPVNEIPNFTRGRRDVSSGRAVSGIFSRRR